MIGRKHHRMTRDALLGLLALLLTAGLASAQSLGDVARKEEVRRKVAPPAAKVYTNGDLKESPAPVLMPPAPLGATPAPDAKTDTKADVKPASGDVKADAKADPKAADGKSDEATWRRRRQTLQESLDRAMMFVEALQSRINGLTADFSARDDPAQRNSVAADRQRSLTEIERVKKEVQQYTQSLADLQEEARKSGVPAGWLR
jgi:hypothetical protein